MSSATTASTIQRQPETRRRAADVAALAVHIS